MKEKQVSIKLNFIMNALLNISYIVFPLVTFPYISRILLPEGTGKITFASSFIQYFLLISQLGIQTYGIRECAKIRDNRERLSEVVSELLLLNIILMAISYALLFIFIIFVPRFQGEQKLYVIMSMTILFNTLGVHYLYKGLEQYTYITVRSIIFKFIALIAMFLFVHKQEDYVIYGAISVFAASASSIMNFLYSKKFVHFKRPKLTNLRQHLKAIGVFFALDCAISIYTNLDVVMLGFITNDAEVGYYNTAVKIKTILVSLITSLGAVLLPRVSYYMAQNQRTKYEGIIKKAIYFIYLAAVPLMLFFIILAAPCVYFLAGDAYAESILPMKLIMPTLLFAGLSNLTSMEILIPFGKERYVLISQALGISTDIVLNAILIPRFSSSGAAIATVLAEMIVLIVQIIYARQEIRELFGVCRYYKIFVSAGLSTFVILVTYNLYSNVSSAFVELMISAVEFFVIYGVVLFMLKDSFFIEIVEFIWRKVVSKIKIGNWGNIGDK